MRIADPGLLQRMGERILGEMWIVARTRNGPDIEHALYAIVVKQIEKLGKRPVRMADGADQRLRRLYGRAHQGNRPPHLNGDWIACRKSIHERGVEHELEMRIVVLPAAAVAICCD